LGTFLGPVPARAGEALRLFCPNALASSTWTVYNIAGQVVATTSFGASSAPSWSTANVASGVYLVRVHYVTQAGQAASVIQKVVVLR
jgi:hypothetical protein